MDNARVYWDENESKLHLDVKVDKPTKLKADIYDCALKPIVSLCDRFCSSGGVNITRKLNDFSKGIYVMKIISDAGQNVIRFRVN